MLAWGRGAALVGMGALVVAIAGCGTTSSELSPITRAFRAGTTVPAPMALPDETAYCPPVSIMEGGSVMQSQRTVVTLGEIARECTVGPNGATIVKVGVEGRIVLGSGSGGRTDVPVRISITQNGNVLANRGR